MKENSLKMSLVPHQFPLRELGNDLTISRVLSVVKLDLKE